MDGNTENAVNLHVQLDLTKIEEIAYTNIFSLSGILNVVWANVLHYGI